jgi:hypothetical protein
MSFSNTVVDIIPLANGLLMEYGTFDSASVTTGTITAADGSASYTAGLTSIGKIIAWGFASDGDNDVKPAKDVAPNKIKVTTTSSDTGDYWIIGKAV